MKWTLFVLACVSLLMFSSGCSEKEDVPEVPAESAQSEPTPSKIPEKDLIAKNISNQQAADVITFDQVLQVWASGQQDQAVDLFLKIQWEQPDIFALDSIFQISEAEFVKLPKDQRLQNQQKAMKLSKDIMVLAKFIVQQAKHEGVYEATRNALIDCGKRLSRDDQLLLVQMVGKAIVGYTEKELPVF